MGDEGKFFAAAYTVFDCGGHHFTNGWGEKVFGFCPRWDVNAGRCRHPKVARLEYRFYEKIGPAKSYVTQKRKHNKQTEEQAFVLVGNIADMIRIDADAQARYEHEESRSIEHANAAKEAQKDASAPKRKPRKRQPKKEAAQQKALGDAYDRMHGLDSGDS